VSFPKLKATLKPRYGKMNGLETRWAQHLDLQLTAGKILHWAFEPEKFRLADGAYYTPDFRVILPDGTIRFDECKGFRREAAIVRLKVAADQHPYQFQLVKWVKKQWVIECV